MLYQSHQEIILHAAARHRADGPGGATRESDGITYSKAALQQQEN